MTLGAQDQHPEATRYLGHCRLRAIVSVDETNRVRCQQPGCGHSVYAAIHIVEEDGRLLVLGSTCFSQRYGGPQALGQAQHGGTGHKLTDEERWLLIQNTEALLAKFQAQADAEARERELSEARAQAEELRRQQEFASELQRLKALTEAQQTGGPAMAPARQSPWPWQLQGTSVALFKAPNGARWVRVQHKDQSQKLVPWPTFEGWETALPSGVGKPDPSLGAITVDHIVEAIQILRNLGFAGPEVGRWQDILSPRREHPRD